MRVYFCLQVYILTIILGKQLFKVLVYKLIW